MPKVAVLSGALAAAAALAGGVLPTAAAFTASASVTGNGATVDSVESHFSAAPGPVALGYVASPRTIADVLTVRNVSSTTATATLSVIGVPQIDRATFASTGAAAVTLAPGAAASVSVTTSATIAGRGTGAIRLAVDGSRWLYRDFAVSLDAAPVAPTALTATPRAAGRIALAWSASTTTTNLAGYDVYRAAGAGTFTKLNTAPLGTASYEDATAADATSYRYAVRAVSSGAAPVESPASAEAAATADATAPAAPVAVYVDNRNSAADLITGTSEAGARIDAVQTAPVASGPYTTTANASGAYQVTVAAARNVTVTYSVGATDAAGNQSPRTTVTAATR